MNRGRVLGLAAAILCVSATWQPAAAQAQRVSPALTYKCAAGFAAVLNQTNPYFCRNTSAPKRFVLGLAVCADGYEADDIKRRGDEVTYRCATKQKTN